MNAEFNWWLLIVGLVAGAGLVWLVIADWSRREEDVAADERAAESAWIAQTLRERGAEIDPDAADAVLALHREYLRQTGTLEEESPAGWDGEGGDDLWSDEAGPVPGDGAPAWHDGEGPTSDASDDVAAVAAGTAPGASDGNGTDDVPAGAPERGTPSVRAMPLSPRGTASNARGGADQDAPTR